MKTCRNYSKVIATHKSILPFACLILLFLAGKVGAANQWWDNNGAAAATSGVWDLTTSNWTTSASSNLTASTVLFTNGNFPEFVAGTTAISNLTITVNTNVTCAGMAVGLNAATVTNLTFSGTGSIAIASGMQSFNCGGTAGNMIINVPLTGAGGITQHGNGYLALEASNSYTAGTALTGGQVIYYYNNSSFGTGPITVGGNGNALANNTAPVVALTITNPIIFPTAGYALNLAGGNPVAGVPGTIFTGAFTLPSSGTINLETSSTATMQTEISGAISGASGLQISDSGTMILAGANTYTGPTSIGGLNGTTTVSVSSLNSVSGGAASSSLGVPGTVSDGTINMGTNTFPAVLIYTGVGETSDRVINLAGNTNGNATIQNDGTTGALIFTSSFTAGGIGPRTLTLQGSNAAANTISGSIVDSGSGTTAVAKAGTGNWVLSGANTYTGGTTNKAGTLSVNAIDDSSTSAIGNSGTLSLMGTSTLSYTGAAAATTSRLVLGTNTPTIDLPAGNLTLAGTVKGTAAFTLIKTSPGTLTLGNNSGGAADNAFLGMNILGGTVVFNVATTPGSVRAIGAPTTVGSNATLQLSGSGGAEINNNVSLTVSNGAVFDLNSQSDSIGGLNLSGTGISSGGALINSSTNATSTLTGPVTLAAGSSIGGSGNITLAGIISGIGMPLTYSGTGVLTLSNANTYSGGTTVSSGTLDGSVAGSVPGNLTLTGTGMLELDVTNAMSTVATLTLPASGSNFIVNLTFTGTQNIGSLMIGTNQMPAGVYGGLASNPNGYFANVGILNVGSTYWDENGADAASGTNVAGGGTGIWNNSLSDWWVTGNSDTMWAPDGLAIFAGTAGTVTLADNVNADGLMFTTAGYTITNTDGVSVLTLDGANPTIAVPAGSTTIQGAIAVSTTNALAIVGPGTLALNGVNTYTTGTTINNGATLSANTIADANCSIGPSGSVVFNGGGVLSYTGAGPAVTSRGITANGPVTSFLDVPAGSLEVDGQIRSGVGSTGQIYTKTSPGTLIMGGAADNSGVTMAIDAGTVVIIKASTATVHGLGGGTSTVGSGAELQLAGTGNAEFYSGCILTVSNNAVFDVNGQNDSFSTLTLAGSGNSFDSNGGALINSATGTTSTLTNAGSAVVLSGPTTIGGPGNITLVSKVSGANPITYAGTGILKLTNANTYSGGTTINTNGTVTLVTAASAAGTGPITDNGTLNVNIVGNNVILSNAISGAGVVNMIETSGQNLQLGGSMSGFTGTLNCPASASTAKVQILTPAVSINSAATINVAAGGTLYVADSGVVIPCPVFFGGLGNSEVYGALRLESNAVISGPVTLLGNTTMGNSHAGAVIGTVSGPISQSNGTFGLTFTAVAGTIVLSGTNTYGGGTLVSGGMLQIGGAGELGGGNYAANLTNNALFNYASSASQTLSGVISGTGALIETGPGPLTLTKTNTYTGGTQIANNGTLTISGSGSLGATATSNSYAGAITNNGTFNYGSSAAQFLSGVISGTGALNDGGPGPLTLKAADTYSGPTTVGAGATLALASTGSINNTAALNLAAGATLDVSAFGLTYTFGGGTTLKAAGTGTNAGTTAALIKGGSSATVNIGGTPVLTFTPTAFSGDTNHPALYVSPGGLGLTGSGITVSNAAATPLGAGTYSLIQVPGGSISAAGTNVTVTGTGLATNTAASLSVSGGSLNLVVAASVVPVPVINSVALSGGNLIFSGTNGPNSGSYHVLTSTNVTLPLTNWTVLSSNNFSPTGTFNVTNAVGADPNQFFVIKIP